MIVAPSSLAISADVDVIHEENQPSNHGATFGTCTTCNVSGDPSTNQVTNDQSKSKSTALIDLSARLDKVIMKCHAISLEAKSEADDITVITTTSTADDDDNDCPNKKDRISQTLSLLQEIQCIVQTNPKVLTTRIESSYTPPVIPPPQPPSSKPSVARCHPPCQSYHTRFLSSLRNRAPTTNSVNPASQNEKKYSDYNQYSLPLQKVTYLGNYALVQLLLKYNPKLASYSSTTPPNNNIKKDSCDVAKILPIHIAIQQGHLSIFKLLLQAYPQGIHIPYLPISNKDDLKRPTKSNSSSSSSSTSSKKMEVPLLMAITAKQVEMTKLILEQTNYITLFNTSRNETYFYEYEAYSKNLRYDETIPQWEKRTTYWSMILDTFELEQDVRTIFSGLKKKKNCRSNTCTSFSSSSPSSSSSSSSSSLSIPPFYMLHNAIGIVPVDEIHYIVNTLDVDLSLRNNEEKSPMEMVVSIAAGQEEYWKDYYLPILEIMVKKIQQDDKIMCDKSVANEEEEAVVLSISTDYLYTPLQKEEEEEQTPTSFLTANSKFLMDTNHRPLLHIVAEAKLHWEGIKDVLYANIDALNVDDVPECSGGLLPFMLLGTGLGPNETRIAMIDALRSRSNETTIGNDGTVRRSGYSRGGSRKRAGRNDLTIIYELLRIRPDVLERYTF